MLKDPFNRSINYLRISITEECNLRCIYCMPRSESGAGHYLEQEEILQISRLLVKLGISKIRLTGGEPLLRKDLPKIIEGLKEVPGIKKVYLTTNALLLKDYIKEALPSALPNGINISIDALSDTVFKRIKGIENNAPKEILSIIDNLLDKNISVKINCVPLESYNEEEIIPITYIAKDKNVHVRFIELMPLGSAADYEHIKGEKTAAIIEKKFGALLPCPSPMDKNSGPAVYYSLESFKGKIGFINPLSHAFCGSCNRLRLNSRGILRACLSSEAELDIITMLMNKKAETDINNAVRAFVNKKPALHTFLK